MPIQRCLISRENNPYFNLAAEEYFLKNTEDEIFMVYINQPSVVVGKHQNLLKEINAPWCYKHNIILSRRLSGGGTVYQDQGNINFSFILNCPTLDKVNYKKFTYPILQSIKSFGLNVQNSDRNDILLNDLKISGNAMHIFKNRVLCHGTLLFKSDLKNLKTALDNNGERYIDKSIKSVSSKVVNIAEFLPKDITENYFIEKLFQNTIDFLDNPKNYSLTTRESQEIKKLANEKYSTWDWIYGYSPKYLFRNKFYLNNEIIEISMSVEKGVILETNSGDENINNLINNILINRKHDYKSIESLFTDKKLNDFFQGYSVEEFCDALF